MDCKKDSFVCSDGKCIPAIWKCDGVKDCSAGSDEDTQLCINGKALVRFFILISRFEIIADTLPTYFTDALYNVWPHHFHMQDVG